MRNTLAILLAALALVRAGAQGVVEFTNIGNGIVAPVTYGGTTNGVEGPDYVAQLYAGPASTAEGSLVPITTTVLFESDGAAGFFYYGYATNSFVAPGQTGTFQVRAFSAGFANYEAAFAAAQSSSSILVGKSTVFQNPTGFFGSPTELINLTSFSIAPVPEPRTLGLLAIGAAMLLFRSRR